MKCIESTVHVICQDWESLLEPYTLLKRVTQLLTAIWVWLATYFSFFFICLREQWLMLLI